MPKDNGQARLMSLESIRRCTRLVRRVGYALPLLLLMAACGGGAEPSDGELRVNTSALSASFDWRMPDLFGTELDTNGIARLFPSAATLGTASWTVTLDACTSGGSLLDPIANYTWDVQLNVQPAPGIPVGTTSSPAHVDAGSACSTSYVFPSQGTFPVTLTITTQLGSRSTLTKYVTVKNYLIVAMGDSVASGEGNPDIPSDWSHPVTYPDGALGPADPVWSDRRCHRSHWSYAAQAALAFEQADPHSSVTFLSTACSGAGIVVGLIYGYEGQEPASPPLPAQIDQVAAAIGTRPIDALILTAGANDIGFGDIVKGCAIPDNTCSNNDWPNYDLTYRTALMLGVLPSQYDWLAQTLTSKLNIYRTFMTDYQDPLHDDRGLLCNDIVLPHAVSDQFTLLNDVGGVDGDINQAEINWAYQSVVAPLGNAVDLATVRNGWTAVDVANDFSTHGYCANNHWIVRYDESKFDQNAPDDVAHAGDGTMHPNHAGTAVIAHRVSSAIQVIANGPPNTAVGGGGRPTPTPVADPPPMPGTMPLAAASGFVWASNPTSSTPYLADPYYASSSNVVINRLSSGSYRVDFPNIGATVGGNVQVTAYGWGNERCKVQGWGSSGSTLQAYVGCFTPDGAAADTLFTASYVLRSGAPGIEGGYVWAFDPTNPSYDATGTYGWNSTGAPITVQRTSPGAYSVNFGGQAFTGGIAEVTAYGYGSEYCQIAGWGPSSGDQIVRVNCYATDGTPADTLFSLLFTQGSPQWTLSYAYAWADQPWSTATYSTDSTYQRSAVSSNCGPQAQGPVSVTRESTGVYDVSFPGIPFSGDLRARSNVDVTSYGVSGEYCKVAGWYGDTSNSGATVLCFNPAGESMDAYFTVTYSSSFFLIC